MDENAIAAKEVSATGKDGRITKGDVLETIAKGPVNTASPSAQPLQMNNGEVSREVRREKMSMLRKKVAQRLVAVKQETAMLTTFNEVDMSAIMDVRKLYKDKFKEKHGVGLGFMSFSRKQFVKR